MITTNTQRLYRSLRCHGFYLQVDGDILRVTPRSSLTDSVCEAIKKHKLDLIELLEISHNGSRPFIDSYGDLVITSETDSKYHYWDCGQSIWKTLFELSAPLMSWKRYAQKRESFNAAGKCVACKHILKICAENTNQDSGIYICIYCGFYCET